MCSRSISRMPRGRKNIEYEHVGPEAIESDKKLIKNILINLMSNAIKYTPDGGDIEVWSEVGARGGIRVCVRDSGVGIPEDQKGRVFAPFERVSHEYASAQQGTDPRSCLGVRLQR